jgi:hypothetical protein
VIESSHPILKLVLTPLVALGFALSTAGTVQGEEAAAAVTRQSASAAEFARFLASTTTTGPARQMRLVNETAPVAVCEADQQRINTLASLNGVEQTFAQMRKQQLARWAEKGWTAKDAAAAGEPVALNGSGYNLRGAPAR